MKRMSVALVSLAQLVLSSAAAGAPKYAVGIDSVPQGAAIYLEAKEAGVQGQTPHTFKLKRGTYTFILEAEGYQPLTRTVEIRKSTSLTYTLVSRPNPATLTVNAAADAQANGATVRVNGKDVGKVPLAVSLQAGRYFVEVTKEGFKDFSQWIDVQQGEKRTLVATMTGQVQVGNLLVSSNIAGAEVRVNDQAVDTTPALVDKLRPGKYVVEVRANGYHPARQEVLVREGQTTKLNLELRSAKQPLAETGGTIMVLAEQQNVEIVVDGRVIGKAPLRVEGLAEGTHLFEGRKPGMVSAEQSIAVTKGEYKTIKFALKAYEPPRRRGSVRVVSAQHGAEVHIDGTLAGKAPLLREDLDPGPHFITVRKAGYKELVQTVEIKAGKVVQVKADLDRAQEDDLTQLAKAQEAAAANELSGLSSFGAQVLPPSFFSTDLAFGFPYFLEARATAGLFRIGAIALQGGLLFRTFGALNEVGLHTTLRLFQHDPFYVGMLFDLGGGGGSRDRNTFFADLGAVGSWWIKHRVTVSARAYFNFYSDRLCPNDPESDEVAICADPEAIDITDEQMRDRFNGTRFLLAAIVEIPVHRLFNVFAVFEGAPFQSGRRAYTNNFADAMPDKDRAIYGRAGATFKF